MLPAGFRAIPSGHPLAALDGLGLGRRARLQVLARVAPAGDRWFFAGVAEHGGRCSPEPVLAGQFSRGPYLAHNWIELSVLTDAVAHPADGKSVRVAGTPLELRLLRRLAKLVPPGGHLMVEYESPHRRETFEGLVRGIPPAATPLGHALFQAGSGDSFKDWYYAEGGMEGPRKLQGNRARDAADLRRKWTALWRDLTGFLKGPRPGPLYAGARRNARSVLQQIDRMGVRSRA